ncbi:MAG: flagellar biosynthesis anti-sigma factor FlgM [Caldimonas sp.]
MKIGNPADKPVAVQAPGSQVAAAEPGKAGHAHHAHAASAATAATDPSATVALSSTASTLLSGGTSSEFDADKVARMSDAIASGTFKVNAGAIADKLIANAQELLGKVQS